MEHSHGLHLLLVVIKQLGLKINKTNHFLVKDIRKNYDKYVNLVFELQSESENLIATYTTDVLTKDISKKIVLEADNEILSVEFGAKNGSCDIFKHLTDKEKLKKIYYKNRPDDFKYEIAMIDDNLKGGKNDFINNLSCNWGIEVSNLCSKILNDQ